MTSPTSNGTSGCNFCEGASCVGKAIAVIKVALFILSIVAIIMGCYFIWKGFPEWFGEIQNVSPISVGISTAATGVIGLVGLSFLSYCCRCC